jgi:hypothetical protein
LARLFTMPKITRLIDREIAALEDRLAALRTARAALGGAAAPRKRGLKPGYSMSAETRRKLRAAWKRRKAAAPKAG